MDHKGNWSVKDDADDTKRDIIYAPGERWKNFPPNESDEERIKQYKRYKALFKCDHASVFERAQEWINGAINENRLTSR